MGIKNFETDLRFWSAIFGLGITLASTGASIGYYSYNDQRQVIESTIDDNSVYTDEQGQIVCYFEPGQHVIRISRNDAYYHKYEAVDGYMIKEVEDKGWRDNNTVTYVNVDPVIAIGTTDKEGNITFNEFGTITEPKLTK